MFSFSFPTVLSTINKNYVNDDFPIGETVRSTITQEYFINSNQVLTILSSFENMTITAYTSDKSELITPFGADNKVIGFYSTQPYFINASSADGNQHKITGQIAALALLFQTSPILITIQALSLQIKNNAFGMVLNPTLQQK